MKRILCLSLLAGFPLTATQSKTTKNVQLPPQTISAQADDTHIHLTTRIEWRKFPKPVYKNEDLKGQDRSAVVRVYADEQGQIKQASIQESTGLKDLDQLLVNAVKDATVKPHIEDEAAIPTIGYQVFQLDLKDENQVACDYRFNSKNWQAQQQGKKTRFQYVNQPELELNSEQLNGHDRKVEFKLKANGKGQIKQVKINKGSGLYALDQQIITALKNSQIQSKRSASTLWLYKPSSFKDEIQFKLNECN
ncbi:energy transducer TonB [Acinetobacter sp. HR7]|uniref:energy transducer TonB family protein n=1 Tax=Acinetobacter sp. HR7 TaxID=1509403 RepID=UPI0005382CD0|nr:energy transducer TonB [Acinetobacter sp. HR7]KGT47585.1 hypothetical protein GW12_13590 [Acinetobacter sp. HR7]